MKAVRWATRTYERSLAWARQHSKTFDHFWRAKERFDSVHGGRLAAAIAYYGFFAAFALGLVSYSILGFLVSSDSELQRSVNDFLQQNLPFLDVQALASGRKPVGIVGLVGLLLTGVGWVEAMRTSQRAVWELDQQPGSLVVRRAVDLGMLAGLGVLLALSLTVADGAQALLSFVTPTSPIWDWAVQAVGPVAGFGVNLLLAAGALMALPRLRVSFRRIMPPVAMLAVGTTLLTTVGRFYIERTSSNPAYTVVAGTVGALLFLFLFGQLLLYAAAVAATSTVGQVTDLAAGPVRPEDQQDGSDRQE